jgi:hypothetical protein
MGRRRHIEAGSEDAMVIRMSGKTADICKKLGGLRTTTAGEAADYLIGKYGPAELEAALKDELKKMGKKS